MSGFWGSATSTLDNKGRINFPARFRKNLTAEDEETFILTRGTDPCITLYPLSAWTRTIENIKNKVGSGKEFRIVSRRLMYQASEQKIDKQGRLNLPSALIDYAQLNGEVLIVGYEDRLEVWNPDRYKQYVEATEAEYQRIADELDF